MFSMNTYNKTELAFLDACADGDVDAFDRFCSKVDISMNQNIPLTRAVQEGHLAIVKRIVDLMQSENQIVHPLAPTWPLVFAVSAGNLDMVKTLLPISTVRGENSLVLHWAANNKTTDILDIVLPFFDKDDVNKCFAEGAGSGRMMIVKNLLAHADPLWERSQALQNASQTRAQHVNSSVFDFLYPLSNPRDALLALQERFNHGEDVCWKFLERRVLADEERQELLNGVRDNLTLKDQDIKRHFSKKM